MLAGTWVGTPEGAALLGLIALVVMRELRNWRTLTRRVQLRAGRQRGRRPAARPACALHSDWCDGRICRDHGIDCPNALPELGSIYGAGGRGER